MITYLSLVKTQVLILYEFIQKDFEYNHRKQLVSQISATTQSAYIPREPLWTHWTQDPSCLVDQIFPEIEVPFLELIDTM